MRPDTGRWPTPDQPGRYAEALRLAIEAARAAGARLRAEFHRPGGPRGDGHDHADIDAEVEAEDIRPRLTAAFPTWGYRGEETEPPLPPRDQEGHVWLVDPNDGTRAYLRGFRGPATSIGLLRDGLPVLGVLYAYAAPDDRGDLFAWAEGEPLTRNGVAIERRAEERPLGADDFVLVSEAADRNPAANARCAAPARFLAVPSIAYRLALVAAGEGRAAVTISGPGDWDYGAGHALLRAVGGELLGGDGRPVWYTREGKSRAFGGHCFGGDPAVVRVLWQRDWTGVLERLSYDCPYRPVRPRPGQAARDSAVLARAQGCLLGQFAGDALGSQVEFRRAAEIRAQFPEGVRELTGGGPFGTLAGQPTDDSELALMLLHSILQAGGYDPEAAASAYAYWYRSDPFDVGGTIGQALAAIRPGASAAEAARAAASRSSQANGSLMRIAPLPIWGHRLPVERLVEHARQDSQLTHPHPVCQDSVAAFCIAVAQALRGGTTEQVYRAALDWAEAHGEPTVAEALRAAAEPPKRQPPVDGSTQGWVLHALRTAFHQLLHAPSLEEGIVRTISLGGDTDTNAAIAGALLGARHGRAGVPDRWRRVILSCRPMAASGARRPRPYPFWPVDALYQAEALVALGERLD